MNSLRSNFAVFSMLGSFSVAFVACGGSDGSDASATGGDGAGTGGATTGGAGNTGGGATGGGTGTGGNVSYDRVPGTDNYNCEAASGTVPALAFVDYATGFELAVLVTHAPNDTERLFVVEQDGSILIVTGGVTSPTPFLDIESKVGRRGGEQGLLGLAFHPEYATNGLFYVHYSAADSLDDSDEGDTIIEEYSVSAGDPNVADPASARRVLRVDQPPSTGNTPECGPGNGSNHNGGTITFGRDGHLYIALGDGGGFNDCFANAQKATSLLGKILRINPVASGDSAYTTPPDNLVEDVPTAAPEIWDWGLRNPFRMNFDGCTSTLYIGDVGQEAREEVNFEPFEAGRRNYGWPVMEGMECRGGGMSCNMSGFTAPLVDYARGAFGSVIGGSVYRGTAIPALRGTYFYADISGRLWSTSFDGTTVTAPVDLSEDLGVTNVTSIQNGGDGEIYLTDFNSVKRLTAAE